MKSIVVYSGGFDSYCLLNDLLVENEPKDLHLVYFNYGQRNLEMELECVKRVSEKKGVEYSVIDLPKFTWAKSSCLGEEGEEYVPVRNLIFGSFVISIAEALHANSVYFAFINPGEDVEYYCDTSPKFITWLNEFTIERGISVNAPLITYTKEQLVDYILDYDITREDFFSCNTPVDGKPCGKCADCTTIDYMFEEAKCCEPFKILSDSGFNFTDPEVKEKLYSLDVPVREAKLYINNVCNARCSHCYLSHLPEKSSLDICEVIDILAEYGITYIDFFGKETLVNDKVFSYIRYLKDNYPHIDYGMITNGININKYKEELVKYVPELSISLESFNPISRPLPKDLKGDISYLVNHGVEVSISLDLMTSNYNEILDIVRTLDSWGVATVYIKPIFEIGETKDKSIFVSPKQMRVLIEQLVRINRKLDCNIIFEMKQPHLIGLRDNEPTFYEELIEEIIDNGEYVYKDLRLDLEFYCRRYQEVIAISPHGNVLGCGYEMSLPKKSQERLGNVKNLAEVIKEGKKKHYYLKNNEKNTCYFA